MATGMVVLPGFVDSHTHAMFAGSREREFALRSEGATYQDIAGQGGGILSTVSQVRKASKRELKHSTSRYLTEMLRHGTTTAEIKSGYGLAMETEVTMLEALRELRDEELSGVVPTFLGAHALPPEFAGNLPGTTQTMPLAVYLALESDTGQAIVLSLVLIVVSFGVLVALRDRWLGGDPGAVNA